ncbi:phytanoyl-CoA dioxygenase family protein [soil metagenome]
MSSTRTHLPDLSSRHDLDDALVAGYRRDGHTLVQGLASPPEVTAYRQIIGDATRRHGAQTLPLEQRDTYGKAFVQVANLWRHDEVVARFVLADRFAAVAARLLGVDQVRIYHDQALYKEPGGGPTPWHQDCLYWPFDTDLTITMWMPLVDVAADMGGLSFASGSWRERALGEHVISDESDEFFEQLLTDGRFPVYEPGRMAAGDATFHAGWTLHRARPNNSEILREVMTVIYVAADVRVADPTNREQEVDLAKWLHGHAIGDLVAGDEHPALSA